MMALATSFSQHKMHSCSLASRLDQTQREKKIIAARSWMNKRIYRRTRDVNVIFDFDQFERHWPCLFDLLNAECRWLCPHHKTVNIFSTTIDVWNLSEFIRLYVWKSQQRGRKNERVERIDEIITVHIYTPSIVFTRTVHRKMCIIPT